MGSHKVETFDYQAEMKRLLHLIVHSLYSHSEIFLRELISNACDALNKVRYLEATGTEVVDQGRPLEIRIRTDPRERTFVIEDGGIGMTRTELLENIGTVARSGTLEFLRRMQEERKDPGEMIGRFGVGFYSVFMVTDEVTIETRPAEPGAAAHRWRSRGESTFTLEEIDRPQRGTRISFRFKDDAAEFADPARLREIIRRFSYFTDFPVYLGEERVNTLEAPWRKPEAEVTDEDRTAFYRFLTDDDEPPLAHRHLSVEGAGASFRALLFLPRRAPFDLLRTRSHKTLQLYTHKVLIMEDCKDLLPEYLQFLRGVVETADLPLNVSREAVQKSPGMGRIRSALTDKVLQWLQRMSVKESDRYRTFFQAFGPLFKTGLATDPSHRRKLIELLRFESSALPAGELTSFKEYVDRMPEGQKAIYVLAGDNREDVEHNPALEYFRKHGKEVAFFIDPVDVLLLPLLTEYEGRPVTSIDRADLELDDAQAPEEDNLSRSFIEVCREVLKDSVEDIRASRRLVDSPVALVTGSDGLDRQTERVMKRMGQATPEARRVLEVNLGHPLVRSLARRHLAHPSDPFLRECIRHLYETARLLEGELPSRSEFVRRMTAIMERAVD